MSEWFIINSLSEFTDKVRAIVYNNFGQWDDDKSEIDILIDDIKDEEKEEFDKILTHQESLTIVKQSVKKQRNKKTGLIRYILNEEQFAEIIHSLNDRLVSNILNSLVNKGLVESSYDIESNDFVFWIKDNEQQKEEHPETD